MGKGVARVWPDDDKLVAHCLRFDAMNAAAQALDPPATDSTLTKRLQRIGRLDEVKDGLRAKRRTVLGDVDPLDPQRVRLTQLEAEVKQLRSDRNRLETAVASQEEIFERFRDVVQVPVRVPKFKTARQNARKPTRSVIAPIFDQQYGQQVRKTDTPGGRGAYDTSVFDQRLARWVEAVCGILRDQASAYRLDELIIPFGGDHVEGDEIFAGQAWQLQIDPPQQVWQLAEKMAAATVEVVRCAKEELGVPWVAMYGVDDNHGKVGGKKGGARPATYSWNWLFLKTLFELRLQGLPVNETAIEPGGALFFKCQGHEFQLIHGHQIRGWGGLPFYGLSKFDGRSIRLHNRIYRYLLMGHHHQPAEIPNGAGETIVSGDWVGANNLSGAMTAASRPQQRVIFVSRKWGVTGSEKVWFTDAEEAYAQAPIYGQAA